MGREISEERVFTPTSLFTRLRETLIQRKLLQILGADYKIDALRQESFVEFTAVLQKNPLVEVIEAIIKMLELYELGPSHRTLEQMIEELNKGFPLVKLKHQPQLDPEERPDEQLPTPSYLASAPGATGARWV
ncbi:MAG: hypothetical protein M5R40_27550 [Anaerolineae bacterium]|nr:hypothetical protein [Anaerolineae bacterium]